MAIMAEDEDLRLLTVEDVLELTTFSRATLHRRVQEGRFPLPIEDGRRRLWCATEIRDWKRQKLAARAPRSARDDSDLL